MLSDSPNPVGLFNSQDMKVADAVLSLNDPSEASAGVQVPVQ